MSTPTLISTRFFISDRDPTVNDGIDSKPISVEPCAQWCNTDTGKLFFAQSVEAGSSVWKEIQLNG